MPAKRAPRGAPEPCGYYGFATVLGTMGIVWQGDKILGTHLPENDAQALQNRLEKRSGQRFLDSLAPPAFVLSLAKKIQRHLSGEAQEFSPQDLALEAISPFFRAVYTCAMKIPSGKVLTYGELAKRAGSPHASRAVGQAMAKNPFVLVVPCHRVLGSTKKLVGFSAPGGLRTKEKLLQLEGYPA